LSAKSHRLLRQICARDPQAAFVGGCVRDWLLGRPAVDLDISTTLDPRVLGEALLSQFGGHFFFLREEDETARVLLHATQGPVVQVDLVRRHKSLKEDLLARDFTANSLGLLVAQTPAHPERVPRSLVPNLLDPSGGRRDLARGILRLTREDALLRDPLRSLRALRISQSLRLFPEPRTLELLRRDAPLLGRPSRERVRDELFRLLEAPQSAFWLELASALGLLPGIFAGAEEPALPSQPPAELRCLRTLDSALPRLGRRPLRALERHLAQPVTLPRSRLSLLRWCALLLDLWPELPSQAPDTSRVPHEPHRNPQTCASSRGGTAAASLCHALRLSSNEARAVRQALGLRLSAHALQRVDPEGPAAALWRHRLLRDAGREAPEALLLALSAPRAAPGAGEGQNRDRPLSSTEWRWAKGHLKALLSAGDRQPLLLSGEDLRVRLGVRPGPRLARLLGLLGEAQAAGTVHTPEEAEDYLRSRL
jgi:tRNA nucleotidyltransferase/poly(A) polymerase